MAPSGAVFRTRNQGMAMIQIEEMPYGLGQPDWMEISFYALSLLLIADFVADFFS